MAKLTQVQVTHNVLSSGTLQYVSTLGILVCLLTTLLGIKVWWFKRRLTFDGTQHDLASDNYRSAEREPVLNRSRSSLPRKANHRRSQQQYDEPVTVHGVFRKREEYECENDIVTPSQLPPVQQPVSMRKKPSFFRTLTRKQSQKAHDLQTRPATISTGTLSTIQIDEISKNMSDSREVKTNNYYNFKRATLPLTRTMPMMPTIGTTTTTTTPTIKMLAVAENEPDVLLHASIIPVKGGQPKANQPQQQQQQQEQQTYDQQLSSSPSLSSVSSLERFSSFSSDFDMVLHHKNHNHDVHDIKVKEIDEEEIFKKISKELLEQKYINEDNNNNENKMPQNNVNNNNDNNKLNTTSSVDVDLVKNSEVDCLPEKPPRKHEKANVKPVENTIVELFEQAASTEFENDAERLSIDFGTDDGDELDELKTTNQHIWQPFSWENQNHNHNNNNHDDDEFWLQHQQQDEKEVELQQEELLKVFNKQYVIKNQFHSHKKQQEDEEEEEENEVKEEATALLNDNINNNAFGKSIDEDWENFEKLAQTPMSMTIMEKPIEDLKEIKTTTTSNIRKMSRGNLKVTFDLEDHYLPAATNNYDSDSSSNDSRYDWHKIRKKYVNALTKDAAKILTYDEDDIIKLPPPLPLSSPPILTLTYYDDDIDYDHKYHVNNGNYQKNCNDNHHTANDSIISVNIKPLENLPRTTNGMPPQPRPRTTVQVHHAMNEDFLSERSTDA